MHTRSAYTTIGYGSRAESPCASGNPYTVPPVIGLTQALEELDICSSMILVPAQP